MGNLSLTAVFALAAGYLLTALLFFRLGRHAQLKKLPGPRSRRRFARVKPPRTMPVEVQLMSGELLEVLTVKDISEGGLGVVAPRNLSGAALQKEVELIVVLPHEPSMRLRGEVKMGDRDARGQAKCGVEFRGLSDGDRARIRAYVTKVLEKKPFAAR